MKRIVKFGNGAFIGMVFLLGAWWVEGCGQQSTKSLLNPDGTYNVTYLEKSGDCGAKFGPQSGGTIIIASPSPGTFSWTEGNVPLDVGTMSCTSNNCTAHATETLTGLSYVTSTGATITTATETYDVTITSGGMTGTQYLTILGNNSLGNPLSCTSIYDVSGTKVQ